MNLRPGFAGRLTIAGVCLAWLHIAPAMSQGAPSAPRTAGSTLEFSLDGGLGSSTLAGEPDCIMCCADSARPAGGWRALGNSIATAGTAAAGLTVVGLLIKRRRRG
ncbi:MAG: hypothetical protein KF708_17050 [Pirellulales bacterium]|nr:hypothetical protein [Pirellulales bacterium]